ncbi:MAG TPA: histidine phosphatase family protein [Verrucomicrobiae bacterium]|nr:histidine phosphatase family protein [Verrucomicrobiae bacterium]
MATSTSQKRFRQRPETNQPTRLLLIRHAEVERRYQSAFGGQIDMNLSERGHEQAKILADYLRGKKFDALYTSPMKRAQQTIAPFLKLKNGASRQKILPALREVHFGDWTGFNWEQVREKFGVHPYDWLDEIDLGRVPNGESGIEFRARVEPCLQKIIQKHRGEIVGIFCHGGVIRMMLSTLLGLPLPKTNQFEIEYTSITQVALHPHMAEIELLNFTPWRDLS